MQISTKKKQQGYTMIEMIIVLALFSIFLSITMPHSNMFKGLKEQQELREFKKDILYTRNKAIVESKRHVFYLDYDKNSYFIKRNSDEILKEHTLKYIKLLRNPNYNEIAFTSSGTSSIADTFYLRDSRGKKYSLSIGVNTGKITLKLVN